MVAPWRADTPYIHRTYIVACGVRTWYVHSVPMPATAKTPRWNLRVAPEADCVVREAASLSSLNLTDFVLQAAIAEAERVLADRTRFTLDEPEWDRFVELLDRPVHDKAPGLTKLFTKPSVFE